MTNIPDYPTATPESVWASLNMIAQQLAESDRQRKENERILNEKFAETDRLFDKSRAEFDQYMKESNANFDRRMKESNADFDRRMKKLEEITGGISNNQGLFAEEYFFNSFENGKRNFFGEKFDGIERRVKGFKPGFRDEYDILFVNGASVAIVEVKYKAHKSDIPKVLHKAKTFRINFPEYEKHQIFLGLATMAFYEELEQECISEGIAIVKQVGDAVVINDKHLKVF